MRKISPKLQLILEHSGFLFFKGILNYGYLKKEFRSNSYIENYNRRIKLKLSKFLYGKSKVKISWPLFLYFIRNEEEDYRKENTKFENSIEIKINLKSNEKNDKKFTPQLPLINNILSNRK